MSASNKTESQIWRDTVLIHRKGVLELVKEQQFFIDSHIILVVQ